MFYIDPMICSNEKTNQAILYVSYLLKLPPPPCAGTTGKIYDPSLLLVGGSSQNKSLKTNKHLIKGDSRDPQ